jgi:hypothetical protein
LSQPIPSETEREQTEICLLKEKIEECKQKLQTWPPYRKIRTIDLIGNRQANRVQIDEPNAELQFTHIHHSISRMHRKAPISLVDEYGLPKRQEIDCMIRSIIVEENSHSYSVFIFAF